MRNRNIVDLGIFIFTVFGSCFIFLSEGEFGQTIGLVFVIIALTIGWFRGEIYALLR